MALSHKMMQNCVSEGNSLLVQPGILDSVEILSLLNGFLKFFRQIFFLTWGINEHTEILIFLKHNLVLTYTFYFLRKNFCIVSHCYIHIHSYTATNIHFLIISGIINFTILLHSSSRYAHIKVIKNIKVIFEDEQ